MLYKRTAPLPGTPVGSASILVMGCWMVWNCWSFSDTYPKRQVR